MEKYYVSGCRDDGEATVTCDDSEATFWTLYARDEKGLSQGIIDLAFREDAEAALSVYVERDALQEQVQQLAAEVSTVKVMNDALSEELRGYESDGAYEGPNMHKLWYSNADMPATDAVIREIGAKAVEGFGDVIGVGSLHLALILKKCAYDHAAKLRAGEQP